MAVGGHDVRLQGPWTGNGFRSVTMHMSPEAVQHMPIAHPWRYMHWRARSGWYWRYVHYHRRGTPWGKVCCHIRAALAIKRCLLVPRGNARGTWSSLCTESFDKFAPSRKKYSRPDDFLSCMARLSARALMGLHVCKLVLLKNVQIYPVCAEMTAPPQFYRAPALPLHIFHRKWFVLQHGKETTTKILCVTE